jgi:hypothetical protein
VSTCILNLFYRIPENIGLTLIGALGWGLWVKPLIIKVFKLLPFLCKLCELTTVGWLKHTVSA